MDLRNLILELKRRNVYRAAAAYAVIGWLIVQIATQVFPFFDVPAWGVRLVVLVILIGFPFAVAFAWVYEITPEGVKRTEEVSPRRSIVRQTGRKLDVIIIVVLALAVAVLLFDRFRGRHATAAPVDEKSIAVLPFDNFSENKDDAFFADGIQDDVVTSLAKIQDLKVISRTSVMAYRGGTRNLREIAKALGVTNVLEGSVRRVKDRVLVNVQLIDAINDRHLWANRFDRTLSDAISLQGELATEIAAALKATLSPAEKVRVEKKPTENAEAYTLMLRARELEDSADISLNEYRERIRLYEQAIALDATSARGHAGLSFALANTYHEFEPTRENADRALAEAREALRLDPNSERAHIAMAHWYYWVEQDYEAATAELAIAGRLAPNSTDVSAGLAAVSRRQGRWDEALRYFQKTLELDPRNAGALNELTFTYFLVREWPAAIATADRMVDVAPNAPSSVMFRAYAEYFQTGDPKRADEMILRLHPAEDGNETIALARYQFAVLRRDYNSAALIISMVPVERLSVPSGPAVPRSYLEGCVALARGDREHALPLLQSARGILESDSAATPGNAGRHAAVGLMDALLGRKEEAIMHGVRATEIKPDTKDAILGPLYEAYLAAIYVWTGEHDKALTLLEELQTKAASMDFVECGYTLADLRNRWIWDPLRGNPRFEKLITGPEQPLKH